MNGAKAWQTTNAYPGADRVDTTPPSGGTPSSTWTDSLGHTTKLVDYLATTPSSTATQEATSYRYDAAGRMTGMTDAAGNVWSWSFDALGRQVSATDPDTGTTTTGYDDAGRAVSSTDARGTTLVTTYDNLDRETALNQGTATGPLLASWNYDTLSKGQPTSSSSYVGSVSGTPGASYTQAVTGYDAADRPTGQSTTLPAGTPMAGTYTTTLSYKQDGSPYQQVDPAEGGINAETLEYSYDGLGKLAGLKGSIANVGSYDYVLSAGYTYLGNVAQYSQARGSQTFYRTFTWADGTNRLNELQGTLSNTSTKINTVASDSHFSYDNAGNVTGVSTSADGTSADNQCFGYDPLRDLTQAWTPSSGNCAAAPTASALGGPAPYWTSYTVDPATGNRTKTVEHSANAGSDTTDTYAYPAAGQAHPHAVQTVTHTTGSSTTTDSYGTPDAAGDTVTRPGQTLSYDARGKLGSVTLTANGQQQTQIYDASGNLLVQSDPVSGTTAYLGDTQLHVAAGSTTVTASRTYTAIGQTVGERDTTAGVAGSTLYFLDPDPLGTATVEVRATDGKITRRYQDPFGVARGTTATWSSARGYLNAPTSSFSGLTQLGARAYDPSIGRFTSADPLLDVGDRGSLAAYAYADNNPVTYSDPWGLLCQNGPDGMCVVNHVTRVPINPANISQGSVLIGPGSSFYGDDNQNKGQYGYNMGHTVPVKGQQLCNAACYDRMFPHGGLKDFFAGAVGGLLHAVDVLQPITSLAHAMGFQTPTDQLVNGLNHLLGADPRSKMYGIGEAMPAGVAMVAGTPELGLADVAAGRAASTAVEASAGAAEAGPGAWTSATESMSERAAAYQALITGKAPGMVYRVNDVDFDGFADGALQEAKGPGYAIGVKNGVFQPWYRGAEGLALQANRQLLAAGGTPIVWSVAESDAATAIMNLFNDRGIAGIDVRWVP